ncbi:MAG: sigma-70 family RNA polymerase sigma factor [Verrucomicrobiota bacterium]
METNERFPWEGSTSSGADFKATVWTDLEAVVSGADPVRQREALERLCRNYWKPVYAYIRRRGNPPDESRDLTQDFFHHLLRKERLKLVDQRRGRFRSFILRALQNFLASDWDRRSAQKRDVRLVVSLDAPIGDGDWLWEPASESPSPDHVFDRLWALDLLDRVRIRLENELGSPDQRHLLRLVPAAIQDDRDTSYATLAVEIGKSVDAVKKAAERLRKRWFQILREEVAFTVQTQDEVDPELREILAVLRDAPPRE